MSPPLLYPPEELVRLYDETGSLGAAAERAGCSKATVSYALKKLGRQIRTRSGPRGGIPLGTSYRKTTSQGYVVWVFRYWKNDKRRYQYVLEHRILMEHHLGRPLTADEQIHHKNGVRSDNRIENFEVRVGSHGTGLTHCPHCGLPLNGQ